MLSSVARSKNNTAFGFNPEVAFSYIDQRLQDVLGHFQKDFERETSAENLGPKFGQESSPPGSEVKGVKLLASRATCSRLLLLNYAEYVSSAMDAAQRSLSALKAAQWKYGLQGIAAVKTALDFHFHDMDGFVPQVRLALEENNI